MMSTSHDQARSRAYGLFSRLYRHGLTAADLPIVRSVDSLAPHVPTPFNPDEAAADHYALFGLDVFPYAGAFLDAGGRLGGRAADAARRFYDEAGLGVPEASGESADYLPLELSLLESLTMAEAGDFHRVGDVRHLQRRFLDTHLLAWLPPFLEVLHRQRDGFYRALGELTLDLVAEHRASLGGERIQGAREPNGNDLLHNDATGLKDIAEFLGTPARSGLWLCRRDIGDLSRSLELPRGFGSRLQTLTNLFRSAAEFDGVGGLLDSLSRRIADSRTFYRRLADGDLPVDIWLERLSATEHVIAVLRDVSTIEERS